VKHGIRQPGNAMQATTIIEIACDWGDTGSA
jgi:hypothetical protein